MAKKDLIPVHAGMVLGDRDRRATVRLVNVVTVFPDGRCRIQRGRSSLTTTITPVCSRWVVVHD